MRSSTYVHLPIKKCPQVGMPAGCSISKHAGNIIEMFFRRKNGTMGEEKPELSLWGN